MFEITITNKEGEFLVDVEDALDQIFSYVLNTGVLVTFSLDEGRQVQSGLMSNICHERGSPGPHRFISPITLDNIDVQHATAAFLDLARIDGDGYASAVSWIME